MRVWSCYTVALALYDKLRVWIHSRLVRTYATMRWLSEVPAGLPTGAALMIRQVSTHGLDVNELASRTCKHVLTNLAIILHPLPVKYLSDNIVLQRTICSLALLLTEIDNF